MLPRIIKMPLRIQTICKVTSFRLATLVLKIGRQLSNQVRSTIVRLYTYSIYICICIKDDHCAWQAMQGR